MTELAVAEDDMNGHIYSLWWLYKLIKTFLLNDRIFILQCLYTLIQQLKLRKVQKMCTKICHGLISIIIKKLETNEVSIKRRPQQINYNTYVIEHYELLNVTDIFLFKWMQKTSILSELIQIYPRKTWPNAFINTRLEIY